MIRRDILVFAARAVITTARISASAESIPGISAQNAVTPRYPPGRCESVESGNDDAGADARRRVLFRLSELAMNVAAVPMPLQYGTNQR